MLATLDRAWTTYFLYDDVGITSAAALTVRQLLDLLVQLVDDSLLLQQAVV